MNELQLIDEKILLTIQNMRAKALTWVLLFFTWTGTGKFWVTIAVSLNLISRFYHRLPDELLQAFFAPLLVWAINYVLKRLIRRERPGTANKDIIPLTKAPCFSFPSSHAGSSFSFFFILLWWNFPETGPLGLWALVVSFSRMYLGVHYLTDILGGILVGLLASGIIYCLF